MAHHQHYQSPFGDTTFTKVFVGGLAWETPSDVMRSYFEQFGEILEAVIINDKNTGKSKGYGFVTFRDPESASRACSDPNPVIDGRRANCNIASLGRPRPSPPRGRNQVGNLYQGGGSALYPSLPPPPPPPLPPSPPVIYPPYGYSTYPPDYGYHQTMYNPHVQQAQYYNRVYGASSSAMGTPYYYGYSIQAPRGTFSIPSAQRFQGPPFLYYPTQVEGSSSTYAPPPPLPLPLLQPTRLSFPPSTGDSGVPPQTSTETEGRPATSTSSTT
ncbi:hypothetical protein Pfo_016705 [Paulownia fortunei]|nr:hypothetical protein Pfo_016705 [Paulownia fortunei]